MSDTGILIEFDADTSKLEGSVKEAIKKTESEIDRLQKETKKAIKDLTDYGLDNKAISKFLGRNYQEIAKLGEKIEELRAKLPNMAQEIQKVTQAPVSGTTLNLFERLSTLAQTTKEKIQNLSQTIWQNLGNATRNASTATSGLNTHLSYTMNRLLNIARSAFFFNIFSRSVRALSREMLTLIERDYYLSNSLLLLKANLINAFAPIMRVVLPWIRALADGLVWLAQKFVDFINWLTGSNAKIVYSPFEAKGIVQSYSDLVSPQKIKDIGAGLSKIDQPKFKSVPKLNKGLSKTSKEAKKAAKSSNKLLASFDRIEVLNFDSKNLELIKGLNEGLLGPLDKAETKIPKIASELRQLKMPKMGGGGIFGKKMELPKIKFDVDPKSVQAVENVKNTLKSIGNWFNEHPWAKSLLEWLGTTLLINSALGGILKILPKIETAMLLAFSNPTLLAISAAIAAFAVIVKNWPEIQKVLDKKIGNTEFTGNDAFEAISGWNPRNRSVGLSEELKNKLIGDGIPPEVIESINKAESAESRWNEKIEKTENLFDIVGKKIGDSLESFTDFVDENVWGKLGNSLKPLMDGLATLPKVAKSSSTEVNKSISGIGEKSEETGKKVEKDLPQRFESAANKIKSAWGNVKKWASEKALDIKKWFSDRWNDFIKYGQELIDNAIKGIKIGWANLKSWANTIWTKMTNWVSNLWNDISENVSKGLKNCWDSIYNWFANIGKEIGKWWNKIWGKLPDAFKGILDFANHGFNLNIFGGGGGNIPQLANGAVLRGGDPFLAYLNDQPRGQTNVEAPLSTIIDAIREAFPEQATTPVINITADGDLDGIIRLLNLKLVDEQRRVGTSMVEVSY